MEQPLRARVWGYADPTPSKKTHQVLSDELFVTCKTGDTQPAILESFNIVCFSDCADSTSSEAVQAQTMEMTLVAAMLNDLTSSLPITAFDMI
ncbi:hypothetical protein MAR_022238, partial [Mya arenaria]